jgi:predicted regulator of Ras-like GTPase activity (Roadblock/LC7/MglB family)
MDLEPSIWLSSITGALLFFSGGRLWGKAVSRREVPASVVGDDGAALVSAEQETVAAREACAQVSSALEIALTKIAALQGQLTLAEKRTEELRTENVALRREVEERRHAQASLADVQRRNLELEVEELRVKVRELEARGFALTVRATRPALQPTRPAKAGQKLEEAIAARLDELRRRRGSCQTAILADVRGLLVASCGDVTNDEALAAATSIITETTERMRELLPLGETLEIRLMDVNRAELTVRWLRDDEGEFLLGTLGVTRERADPRADAIEASISDLLRAPAPQRPHVPA